MDFPTAVRSGFANYATFAGRARRSAFWFFCLFNLLAHGAAGILDAATFGLASPLNAIVSLVLFLPNLALAVRRLHDVGRSGWWLLVGVVPLVGIVVLLLWWVSPGEDGPNRYGPDPRGALPGEAGRPWPGAPPGG